MIDCANAEKNDWTFVIGGEERLRVEFRDNFDFDNKIDDQGCLVFQRILINGKLKYKKNLTLFIECKDIREISNGIKKTNQYDDFDLYQGYLEYKNNIIDLKIGRQKFGYGDKRILAAPFWSNKLKSFDAIKASIYPVRKGFSNGVYLENFTIDLFGGNIVLYDDNNFNDAKANEYMYGSYIGYKNKDFFIPEIELIYLTVYNEDDLIKGEDNQWGKLNQHTVDALVKGSLFSSGIDYCFEFAYQFGKYGTNDIKDAYAIHVDVKRKFNTFLKPELKLEYNNASGDKDPNDRKTNTFISYYQSTHHPYGIMDFFRWQNMREVAFSVKLNPTKKFSIMSAVNCFWLDEKRDSWYKSSGSKIRTATNSQVSDFVGTEISTTVKYNLNKHVKFELGYAHFFTSSYVKDTGSDDHADWGYLQTEISF
ncbi:MAG: alginate export family protein [Candidatus Omnitrophica bacterium]|nr:alginate export family protein [Candidatus Omnitrophota bacterium]